MDERKKTNEYNQLMFSCCEFVKITQNDDLRSTLDVIKRIVAFIQFIASTSQDQDFLECDDLSKMKIKLICLVVKEDPVSIVF